MKLNILLLLSILITSCAATLTDKVYEKHLTKTYQYPERQCFSATESALIEMGFEIDKSDAASGKIISKRKETDVAEKCEGLLCHYDDETVYVPIAVKYYFLISAIDEASCEVKAERFRVWRKGVEAQAMNIKYVNTYYWEPVLNEVYEKLIE